jgi:hypothetical protein
MVQALSDGGFMACRRCPERASDLHDFRADVAGNEESIMPSIRASAKVNTQGWEPAPQAADTAPNTATAQAPDPTARSPFMLAAMPLMASTGDAFARQFYGGANLPQQRILPAKRGQGA